MDETEIMDECIFCKIVKNEIPSNRVFENGRVLAFRDISPKAPVHILVIPKPHINSLVEVNETNQDLLGEMMVILSDMAKKEGIDKSGYKVVANNGRDAGQLVSHLHFHLLGGWKKKESGWKV